MEFIQVLSTAIIAVISALLLLVYIAYIVFLGREDRSGNTLQSASGNTLRTIKKHLKNF